MSVELSRLKFWRQAMLGRGPPAKGGMIGSACDQVSDDRGPGPRAAPPSLNNVTLETRYLDTATASQSGATQQSLAPLDAGLQRPDE